MLVTVDSYRFIIVKCFDWHEHPISGIIVFVFIVVIVVWYYGHEMNIAQAHPSTRRTHTRFELKRILRWMRHTICNFLIRQIVGQLRQTSTTLTFSNVATCHRSSYH